MGRTADATRRQRDTDCNHIGTPPRYAPCYRWYLAWINCHFLESENSPGNTPKLRFRPRQIAASGGGGVAAGSRGGHASHNPAISPATSVRPMLGPEALGPEVFGPQATDRPWASSPRSKLMR